MIESGSARPTISVVLISYNDEKRLPTAIRSVLAQTFQDLEVIVADDASSDGTAGVVRSFSEADSRVRYVCLPENSGGCGAPRNTGTKIATGEWIFYLDSDDEIEPDAFENLVAAGNETGADVVSGAIRREFVGTARAKVWHPELFEEPLVIDSIADHPERIRDSAAWNKLYRRSFLDQYGLHFDEDILYEDLVFAAAVNAHVARLAVIPNVVYRWKIYGRDHARSITNRRAELRNLNDRIEVMRRAERIITEANLPGLAEYRRRVFLDNDLILYIYEFVDLDDEACEARLEVIKEAIADVSDERFLSLEPMRRVAYYYVRTNNIDGLRSVAAYGRHARLTTNIREVNGKFVWARRCVEADPAAAAWLDVTELRIQDRAFADIPLGGFVSGLEVVGDEVHFSGTVGNPFDLVSAGAAGWLELRVRDTGLREQFDIALRGSSGDDRCQWTAAVGWHDLMALTGSPGTLIDAYLTIESNGRHQTYRLLVDPHLTTDRITPGKRFGRASLDAFRVRKSRFGSLSLSYRPKKVLVAAIRAGDRLGPVAGPLTRFGRRGGNSNQSSRKERGGRELVFFESAGGGSFLDGPRAVFDELVRQGAELELVWGYDPTRTVAPTGLRAVSQGSSEYTDATGRAAYWVDDGTISAIVEKAPGTKYLQAACDTPLKRVGRDAEAYQQLSDAAQRELLAQWHRWDAVVAASQFAADVVASAFDNQLALRVGSPRADALVDAPRVASAQSRQALGVPDGVVSAAYASASGWGHTHPERELVDSEMWVDEMEDEAVLMVLGVAPRITYRLRNAIRQVPSDIATSAALLAADVFVTDYSPLLVDFAVTGRPIIFYLPEPEIEQEFMNGLNFDLASVAPGPVARNQRELHELVATVKQWAPEYSEQYTRFVERFCSLEDGQAAQRVVEQFFSPAVARQVR